MPNVGWINFLMRVFVELVPSLNAGGPPSFVLYISRIKHDTYIYLDLNKSNNEKILVKRNSPSIQRFSLHLHANVVQVYVH